MKRLTKREREIIENLNPRCEDCEHYRDHNGRMMCHAMAPFLAYKETARIRPHGTTMNCGTEGQHFKPNAEAHGRCTLHPVQPLVGQGSRMSSDKDAPERLIDASPEYAAGYGAAMYDVWRRFPPPDLLLRDGLSESELRRLIEFVESCLPNT